MQNNLVLFGELEYGILMYFRYLLTARKTVYLIHEPIRYNNMNLIINVNIFYQKIIIYFYQHNKWKKS